LPKKTRSSINPTTSTRAAPLPTRIIRLRRSVSGSRQSGSAATGGGAAVAAGGGAGAGLGRGGAAAKPAGRERNVTVAPQRLQRSSTFSGACAKGVEQRGQVRCAEDMGHLLRSGTDEGRHLFNRMISVNLLVNVWKDIFHRLSFGSFVEFLHRGGLPSLACSPP
jgi:hypothetical protein